MSFVISAGGAVFEPDDFFRRRVGEQGMIGLCRNAVARIGDRRAAIIFFIGHHHDAYSVGISDHFENAAAAG